ncbi:MAG: lysophospholipase [Planctomycetota bacterium]
MAPRPELYARWRPADDERGAVLVVHGYGEHSGRYEHVFAALNTRRWSCLGIDYRGFGRAAGRRAFVRRFDEYLDDVQWGLDELRGRTQRTPVLLGHSQGGLIAALFAIERSAPLDGLVLSSPALRFALRVPAWKRALAHLLSAAWPTFTLPSEVDARDLTHDDEVRQALREDPLTVRVGTARWYTESLRAQRRVLAGANRLTTPTLLQVAGDDRVVDAAVTRSFCEHLGAADVTWIDYPGLLHEVYQESLAGRGAPLDDLCDWLDGDRRRALRRP